MKEIAYIETTIVSYLVARPSRDLVLSAHQQVTREWWENERVNYHCIASEEVAREAMLGDTGMAQARIKVLEELQIVGITAEVEAMAATFMATGALPPTMRPDATHLAAATLSGAERTTCSHGTAGTWRMPMCCAGFKRRRRGVAGSCPEFARLWNSWETASHDH